MDAHILNHLTKNMLLGAVVLLMMFSFTPSFSKAKFAASKTVPEARGDVKVTKDEANNRYTVKIRVSDLDRVDELRPSKKIYVVWLVSDQYITENLGPLTDSLSAFSATLKTTFEKVTSLKPAKIFITAEDDAGILRPGVQVVLATNRF